MRTACGTREEIGDTPCKPLSLALGNRRRSDSATFHMEDKKAKIHMGETVLHPWQFKLLIKETDKLMNELKQQPMQITDEDYSKDTGCGCVVAFVVVIIIFATAAGLWMFSRL